MPIKASKRKPEPIPRRKLSHQVRDRLLQMIESGELSPGDKMPSEHDLMDLFQVGRPAVREAMQALENMGLLSINHGERATVREPTAEVVIEQIDTVTRQLLLSSSENVEHLKEARQVLEAGVVSLACQRATPEEIDRLGEQLQKMRDNIATRSEFLKADQGFHLMLAEMSRNPIFPTILKALFNWLKDYHRGMLGVAGLENLTLQEHEEIFECVQARDAAAAALAVSKHILQVNSLYPRDYDK